VTYIGCAVLSYFDFMVFLWIYRYFSDGSSEHLLPAFFFSSLALFWALMFWQSCKKRMTDLQKFGLMLLVLFPAIVFLKML
jgi:hypothetical protein